MHLLVAAWLVVGTSAEAAPAASAVSPEAAEAPAASPEAGEAPAVQPQDAEAVDLGAVGLGIAGGGAVLATTTVVVSTLIEALNTPDQEGQPRNERLIQGSGLVATGLVSVGAAMILAGGALVIEDVIFAPSPAAAPAAE